MTARRAVPLAIVVALLLYLPWRSIRYNGNGIHEAIRVERGRDAFVSPNHVLFVPLGAALYATLRAGGYSDRVIGPLQIFSACAGALSVGFALLAYRRLGAAPAIAAAAAALLATSWAHWVFSTDVQYITLAAMWIAAALAVAAGTANGTAHALAVGLCAGLATLAWQANLLAVPALAIGVVHSAASGARLRCAFVFALTAAAVVLVGYLGGALAVGAHSPGAALAWTLSYGGMEGVPTNLWGRWELSRVASAANSWVASIVSVWDGLGLRALRHGEIHADKLAPQLSLLVLLLLVVASALRLIARIRQGKAGFAVQWMCAAFALYLPFIVWWDPFEPKWYVVPNVFLFGALAAIWQDARPAAQRLLWTGVAVIAAANFSNAIWPRHVQPGAHGELAQCVARQLTANDLFVVSDWEWFDYARYFGNYQGEAVWLIDRRGRQRKLDDIASGIADARRRGGRAYMVDVAAYPEARRTYLLDQTELSVADYASLAPQPAFVCGDTGIVELGGP